MLKLALRLLMGRYLVDPPDEWEVPVYEKDSPMALVHEVNRVRARFGRSVLDHNLEVSELAEDHCDHMIGSGRLSHMGLKTRWDLSGARYFGENVAYGHSAAQVVSDWNTSFLHREIQLGHWTQIGVGRNHRYWCAIFIR